MWFVVAAACWCSTAARAVEGDLSPVHDPTAIKCGEAYYLFSTGRGLPIRRSPDLVHWTRIGQVFDSMPEWAQQAIPDARDLWAPDASFHDGKFWLYYSVSTFGKNRSALGLATNVTLDPDDPRYEWVDRGPVIESHTGDGWNAIDPNAVTDRTGRRWLAFGSFWTGLKLVELDPATGMLKTDPPKLIPLARRRGSTAIEAPFLIQRGQYWYLFVSFDQCCRGVDSTYKTMVGRAEKITGPYVDYTGKPMLQGNATLMLASHDNLRGPGHNCVLRDGDRDWLIHHFYDADRNGAPTLQVRPLLWAPDGWPLPGDPVGSESPSGQLPADLDLAGEWQHTIDFGRGSVLRLLQNGHLNTAEGPCTWQWKDRVLFLRWPSAAAPGGAWRDTCLLTHGGLTYVGRNQQGALIRGTRRTVSVGAAP